MLDLVEIEDIHQLSRGKSGKKCGKKFSNVEDKMSKYIEWLKEELEFEEKQPVGGEYDGCLYMDVDKTKERLGSIYKYHKDETLRKSLKYVLLKYGINLKMDTQTNGKKIFIMKKIKEDNTV